MRTNLFNILCFSCQGKSIDIIYQRICLFLRLIFTQHGHFEIQLTVYSALSRLTDLGIYYITRCEIWLLTIFHIQYIHFQRQPRKVTSPKLYISFCVQYILETSSWIRKGADTFWESILLTLKMLKIYFCTLTWQDFTLLEFRKKCKFFKNVLLVWLASCTFECKQCFSLIKHQWVSNGTVYLLFVT